MNSSFWVRTILVLSLVGFAVALRSVGARVTVLSADESFSWRVSTRRTMEMIQDVARDTHPPGHFLLLKGWQKVFGSSAHAQRSLSGVCGGLTVIFVYLAVKAVLTAGIAASNAPQGSLVIAATPKGASHEENVLERASMGSETVRISIHSSGVRAAAFFAAALSAVHPGLVGAGQTARMYAFAALMSAVTAWALVRALHDGRSVRCWWWVYGVAVAGLLYSHNFAWFVLAAQLVFAVGVVTRRGWTVGRDRVEAGRGLLVGLGVALLLYSPWLPIFVAQARRVHEGFWVPAASADVICCHFLKWLSGVEYVTPMERWAIVGVLAATVVWRVAQRDFAANFFLLQAAIPWAATVVISTWGGRPLLQDRYLVPSQVALIGYVAVVFTRLSSYSTARRCVTRRVEDSVIESVKRVAHAANVWLNVRQVAALSWALLWASMSLLGCGLQMSQLPQHSPPIATAARWLKLHYRVGDRVMAASVPELNLLRFYTAQAGMNEIGARCPHSRVQSRGQLSHIASLHAKDVVYSLEDVPPSVKRIWSVNHRLAPTGWRVVRVQTFRDERPPNGGPCTLTLHERPPGSGAAPGDRSRRDAAAGHRR